MINEIRRSSKTLPTRVEAFRTQVPCIERLLMAHVHDSALGPQPSRRLTYLNAKYTAGPVLQLKNLPEAWEFSKGLTIVVGAK